MTTSSARARSYRRVPAVLTLALSLTAVTSGAAQYPTSPPAAGPLRELEMPPFQEARLDNGLDVVVVTSRRLPVVSVSLTMPGGARFEAPGREGLADLVATVLTRGTADRSAEDIARTIEGIGSSLFASASSDFMTVGTTVLTEHVELALELLADVVRHATFSDEEIELARTQTLSVLRVQESQPGFVASKFLRQRLYGAHPYGRTATSASVGAITRDDLLSFRDAHLAPDGSLLTIAGDLDLDEARGLAERFLGAWSGTAQEPVEVALPEAGSTEILLVHRPGSEQSNVLVGNLTMRPGDERLYAATVANRVFGGGSDARLFAILREEKGWTYGAYSSMTQPLGTARMEINTEVRAPVTDSALTEILHQIRRIQDEPVPESELNAAKGFLVGSFPRQIETPQQIASQVRSVKLRGLGAGYLRTYRQRLAAVTADQVSQVAETLWQPDRAAIVVVGDGQSILGGLQAIAPVTIIDTEGNPLTEADLNPAPEVIVFDPAQIVPSRDSLVVLVQGQAFGGQVRRTEFVEVDGRPAVRFTSSLEITGLLSQRSELVVDRETLRPVSLDRVGQQQGREEETHLTYGIDGRVSGTLQSPGANGPEEVVIDTILPEHVMDESMTQALVHAMPLAADGRMSIAVFRAAQNAVATISVRVMDGGTIAVPAGEFDTWQINVDGLEAPITYWVSKGTPRRFLKMAIAGQPVTFELAGIGEP